MPNGPPAPRAKEPAELEPRPGPPGAPSVEIREAEVPGTPPPKPAPPPKPSEPTKK